MRADKKILLDALLNHWNHFFAVMPYNLNWMVTLNSDEKRFLQRYPLVLCDVGARNSAPEELLPFYPCMEYHAFDADEAECERLNSTPHPYYKFRAYPYFIGQDGQKTIFRLYKERGQSSFFAPNKRFKELFGGSDFSVEKDIEVIPISLDKVYSLENLVFPDIIKVDTQGTELEILRGGESLLRNVCLVEVEVEFIEMYEGQPLFHDVARYMFEKGFDLLYLNRVFAQRSQMYSGFSRGQIIFGDALFGRREDRLEDIPSDRLIKYALLLINYGHIDFAYQLTRLYPDKFMELPRLSRIFAANKQRHKIVRKFFNQVDKLSLLLLHLRKYNQYSYDSDRSWPIR